MLDEATLTLCQKQFGNGRQTFEIRDDALIVSTTRCGSHHQFEIPLFAICGRPQRYRHRPTGTIVGFFVFSALSLAVLVWAFFASWQLLFFEFFFAPMVVACIWKGHSDSVNCVVYGLRNGRQLTLWHDNPNPVVFRNFCNTLERMSKEATENHTDEIRPTGIAAELASLKTLKDNGTLSQAEFDKLKADLIEGSDRRIGFR
jgi:hypothetical protein